MLANILENSVNYPLTNIKFTNRFRMMKLWSEIVVNTGVVQHVKQDVTGATLNTVNFVIGGALETECFIILDYFADLQL